MSQPGRPTGCRLRVNRKSKSKWKSLVMIALALVLVPVLLFMCSEAGMMWMHAVSVQQSFQKQVCGENRKRLKEIEAISESGFWIFRQPIKDRPSKTRVELGVIDEYLNAMLESDDDEAATSRLSTLYWYEYCRGNNPIIDVYYQDFDDIVAVFRASTSRSAGGRNWNTYVYDCRELKRTEAVVNQLVDSGYWEKVESIGEGWRGNPILKVYDTPKFHPEMRAETSFEKRGNYSRTRGNYYSAAALYGICTGHHYKLQHYEPAMDSDFLIQSGPKSLKKDIEQIQGLPEWDSSRRDQ
jgi:hypothetical protein